MADPITIIATLHGLAEKLVTNIKSGQDAAKAQEILRLVSELQTEYFSLKSQILQLQAENLQLKQKGAPLQIANPKQQDDNANVVPDLDEIAIKMLLEIANSADGIKQEVLYAMFNLSTGKGDFLFDQLRMHKLIYQASINMIYGVKWGATSKGRAYLNKKGLL